MRDPIVRKHIAKLYSQGVFLVSASDIICRDQGMTRKLWAVMAHC
jgi:hypothetical protein